MFKIKFLVLFVATLSISCSQIKTRDDVNNEKLPTSTTKVETSIENEKQTPPPKPLPAKLGLILGPGSVKAFAHLGVLKELEKAGIPISYIVGIEWGSLIGGLYAESGKINDVDWKIYKLQELKTQKGLWPLSQKKKPDISNYRDFLNQNISKVQFQDLKIPFACPSQSIISGTLVWREYGSMRQSLENCMPSLPTLAPDPKSPTPWAAGLFAQNAAIEFLKKKGLDVIVFVNVAGTSASLDPKEAKEDPSSSLIWHEVQRQAASIKNENGVIKVTINTSNYGLSDFSNRSSLSSAGEAVGSMLSEKLLKAYHFE